MLCSDSVSIPSTLIGRCESDRGMWREWKVSSSGRLGDERTAKAGMEGLRERERGLISLYPWRLARGALFWTCVSV